jgi:repressor LexA
MALTKRQRQIYDYICEFVQVKGYSPSLEEIGAHFGLRSVATVHKHVQHLVEKKYLRKAWNRSRSVEPASAPGESMAVALPLRGTVAAGLLSEAIEDDDTILVPPDMAGRPGETFVLRVRGDSMIEDQIADGDLVVVESRKEARNGETVVALVDNDATLKRFYRRGAEVRLVPANDKMEEIVVPAESVTIRGVVRGLLRHY